MDLRNLKTNHANTHTKSQRFLPISPTTTLRNPTAKGHTRKQSAMLPYLRSDSTSVEGAANCKQTGGKVGDIFVVFVLLVIDEVVSLNRLFYVKTLGDFANYF